MCQELRGFFESGETRTYAWRRHELEQLLLFLDTEAEVLVAALAADLHKSREEAWMTEIAFVRHELKYALKRLKSWMAPKRVCSSLSQWPGRSRIQAVPKGLVLIISPWNYPVQLTLSPLVAALAAGNAVVLKPSELAEATARVLADKLPKYLDTRAFCVVQGGVPETQALLEQPFDHIFFTGSTATAKHIATAAAKHLCPTTLELGGKSPCVVIDCKHIEVAARRIVWAKFINAGQTCVAPDYVLVERSIYPQLVEALKRQIVAFYGERPGESAHYGRIINARHFERLLAMLKDGELLLGGEHDAQSLLITPTLMTNVAQDSKLRQDEIFGPILPIMTFDTIDECFAIMATSPNPLAAYLFSDDKKLAKRFATDFNSGGLCINDALMHLVNIKVPFGGIGNSGMGQSHGKFGFDSFSHHKAIFRNSAWIDPSLRYPPYGKNILNLIKWLM